MSPAPSPAPLPSPVFLVGAERSGSTLLHLMLNSHPEISFFEEFEYSVQTIPADGWPDLAEYYEFLAHDRVYQLNQFPIDRSLDYPGLADSFLRSATSDLPVRGATIHFDFDKTLRIWPDARFIHLLRDPRDVAPSVINMSWAGNVWHALDKWIHAEETWAAMESQLPQDRYTQITFDDLVNDHVTTLTKVCDFLGVAYTDEMLSYAETTDYGVPSPKAASSWHETLSEREVRLVEARVGPQMDALGFDRSGLPALHVGAKERARIKLDSKIRRPAQRANLIGWPLVVAETITNAVGWDGGYKAVRKRSFAKINDKRRRSWSEDEAENS